MFRKLFYLFLFPILVTACAGAPVPAILRPVADPVPVEVEPHFLLTKPAANGLTFIGFAGKRSNPKETLRLSLEDAARRVSAFHRVSGEYAVENNVGSGAFDYVHNTYTLLDYDKEGAAQYVDALQFNADTDTLEIDNTFIIRATYPSALPSPVSYVPVHSSGDQKPDWVDDPPLQIEGYEVGIGYSGRYATLTDTYSNSYNNAIFSIIRTISAKSRSSDMLYQDTESLFGYKTSNDNVLYSYGTLTGFYVLDTWIDPETKAVWTLAIATKSG